MINFSSNQIDSKSNEIMDNNETGDTTDARFFFDIFKRKPKNWAFASTSPNATHYSMAHKNRGRALIFVNTIFNFDNSIQQIENSKDCEDFHKTLEQFSFEVTIHQECKYDEIKRIVKKVSSNNHSDCDCLLIAILSRGSDDDIFARDKKYKLEKISSYFNGDKCPTLAGKPKLFFIQASREEDITSQKTATDSGTFSNYKIPIHADFLFVNFVGSGPWFLQALIHELSTTGKLCDMLTLLTFVNQRVTIDCEETVWIISTMTRILQFIDKSNLEDKSPQ